MKHSNPLSRPALISVAVVALMLLLAAPAFCNSVEDSSGVTWTATRQYNSSSDGFDIRVMTDEFPAGTYWVTADSGGDESPFIALDPDTDYPVVVWSKSVLGGTRIRISWFDGTDFGSPQTVTSGGTQFGDESPHMVIESDGDIHLVFFRDHVSNDGEAVYMKYTGSWSTPAAYSVSGDDVIGSCMIKLIDESEGELESSYSYDQSSKRERCKPGIGVPWTSCD